MITDPLVDRASSRCLKCVIWDLDGTIWSGSLLDGVEPVLSATVAHVVAELDRRGILQSVASANLHDQAWPWLERFGLAPLLVAPEIHLARKHESIARILERLHVRPEDAAFVDDDAMERELVRAMLPAVTVIDSADAHTLPHHPRLSPLALTREGRQRRALVRAELRRREEEEERQTTLADFLRTCETRFVGRIATAEDVDRVVELTERTNRMNATGHRKDHADVAAALADPSRDVLVASMTDRFGDYGTVAAAVVSSTAGKSTVEGLWMSCRAGRRGLPAAFFTFLGSHAYAMGSTHLRVRYRRTDDNRLGALHLGTYGFRLTATPVGTAYVLELPDGIRPYDEWLEVTA